MSYSDFVKHELKNTITKALNTSDFANNLKPSRKRNLSKVDVIRTLMFMQGGSLQKELYEAGLSITPSAFVQRRHQIEPNVLSDALTDFFQKCEARKHILAIVYLLLTEPQSICPATPNLLALYATPAPRRDIVKCTQIPSMTF